MGILKRVKAFPRSDSQRTVAAHRFQGTIQRLLRQSKTFSGSPSVGRARFRTEWLNQRKAFRSLEASGHDPATFAEWPKNLPSAQKAPIESTSGYFQFPSGSTPSRAIGSRNPVKQAELTGALMKGRTAFDTRASSPKA